MAEIDFLIRRADNTIQGLPTPDTCRRARCKEGQYPVSGIGKFPKQRAGGDISGEVIQQHARHHLENKLTGELIAQHAEEITRRAAATALPADLVSLVYKLLKDEPTLSWDQALARLI
jgi:hypothetical protein